jgi:hypothetical protein
VSAYAFSESAVGCQCSRESQIVFVIILVAHNLFVPWKLATDDSKKKKKKGKKKLVTDMFPLFFGQYFGPSFVHDGSNASFSPPQYIDPYELLEDERISQIAPSLK